MTRLSTLVIWILILTTCRHASGLDGTSAVISKVPFDERSRLSAMTEISRRLGFSLKVLSTHTEFEQDYNIANETFEIYVPASYDPAEKWGLLVWLSAGKSGRPPEVFIPLLTKHKLIWAGPNNVHNERPYWCRVGLAVDTVETMKRKYKLDEKRIFIAGGSGGGRTSSIAGVTYPDIFSGGLYLLGCNFYRDIAVPAEHIKELEARGEAPKSSGEVVWRRSYAAPPAALFTMAKKKSRHVIITGENDMNRWQCKENAMAFKRDGFEHVEYMEVPGMGHTLPSADWLDKGLEALNEIPSVLVENGTPQPANPSDRAKLAEAALIAAKKLAEKDLIAGHAALKSIADRYADTQSALEALKAVDAMESDEATKKMLHDAEEASRFLRLARIYVDSGLKGQALSLLAKILADYGDTPSAAEAKEMVKKLGTKE